MTTRQQSEWHRELLALLLAERWGFDGIEWKRPAYTKSAAKGLTQASDITGLPIALNVKSGTHRLAEDLAQAQADAVADGARFGATAYYRPGREPEDSYVLLRFGDLAELLQLVSEEDHADAAA